MFGEGYVLGSLVTVLGLYALSKWHVISEREEKEYDNDGTN